jgi:hypothetical protein
MASGIPFGNTAGRPTAVSGQPYFNGETARLELFTGTSWENIVQEVPGVSSISGTYSEATDSGVITIYGTNFVSGAYATAIGSNGVQINAASTVYNSLVQLTATFTGLSNAQEPYDIKVTNPSNLFGLIPDALYINASPVWVTSSGSLGTFNEQVSISVSATATDETAITYALASGSTLPAGVTLNSSSGLISGTLPDISTDTTYSFTINASDGVNTVVPRAFSITSVAQFNIEALVVAGGGGGGSQYGGNFEGGCGGGAGGFVETTRLVAIGSSYTVTVGAGGAFSNANSSINGSNGANSVFSNITAIGGGVGGGNNNDGGGSAGGSGGGSPNWGDQAGGAALQPTSASGGYGNAGGRHPSNIRVGGAAGGGGGGGGAGSAGGDAPSSWVGGSGGSGRASSITGASVTYAGGGGGYGRDGSGAGGSGGGGAAGTTGTSGTPNTGSGGGGSQNGNSGTGGSGVVIIAYPNTKANLTIGGTLSYDQPTRSGYKVYRFTGGTGTITF